MAKAIGDKFTGLELAFFLNVKARRAAAMESANGADNDDECSRRAEALPRPANVVALLERDRSARRMAKADAIANDSAPGFKSHAVQVAELEIESQRLLKLEREAFSIGDYDAMMNHRHSALTVARIMGENA